MTLEQVITLGKRVLEVTLITCIAAAVCLTVGLAGVQIDVALSQPYQEQAK